MSPEWKLFFHYWLMGAIYTSTAVSYSYIYLLKPRKYLSWNPRTQADRTTGQIFVRVWLCFLIPLTFDVAFRVNVNTSLGTLLVHVILIAGTIILFEDSLSYKLSIYFILIGLLTMTEYITSFAAIVCIRAFTGRDFTFVQVNFVGHTFDKVVMNIFYILFCFLFIKNGTVLLLRFKKILRFRNIAPLFIPTLCVSLGAGLLLYQENSPQLPLRVAVFILIDILCVLLFFLNLQSIAKREENHELILKQAALVRQQLDYSKEIESNYRTIRKENHDIANQLHSLRWMIDGQQYQGASAYLDELIDQTTLIKEFD